MENKRELVVGVDVAKESSEVCILGLDYSICKRMSVRHDSAESMDHLMQTILAKAKDFEATATVVVESTGHYHKILKRALDLHGIRVVVVNPIQSDSIKNLDIRKVKNDKMDARRLAMLYIFERHQFKINSPDDEAYLTLKMLLRSYYGLQTERTVHLLKLSSLVDQVYLGFDKDCLKLSSSAGLAFLAKYPLPQDVLHARKDTVLKCLAKASRKGMTWAQNKLNIILVKARTMAKLGANEAVFADLIRSEIVLYQALDQQMVARLESVKDYLQTNAMSDNPKLALQVALLQTIPGVGLISALTIVAECGDISRFKHPRALTAFAGLDPSVKESGQFKGTRNKISKRGNRQIRRALYMVAMRSVSINRKGDYVNPYLRDFYDRKCRSKPNKVALIAVTHKLIFIIFAVLRDQKPFYWADPKEHRNKINSA